MINKQEQIRYTRQLLLPEFEIAQQEKLKASSVFIIGAGGLGSPAAIYLAAAGIGKIILCDKDRVELSNLNRQILHTSADIDKAKAESAKEKLVALNPEIQIETHLLEVDLKVLREKAAKVDLLIDCLDNVATRKIMNVFSINQGIPLLHAGIDGWSAQLAMLNLPQTPCLNCLFENYIELDKPKPVLGAVAGIVGTMQALIAIKYLAGIKAGISNILYVFNGLEADWVKVPIGKNESCKTCSN